MTNLIITFVAILIGIISLSIFIARRTKQLPKVIRNIYSPDRSLLELVKLLKAFILFICIRSEIPSGLCDAIDTLRKVGAISLDERRILEDAMHDRFGTDDTLSCSYYWPIYQLEPRFRALKKWISELEKEAGNGRN